MTTNPAQALQAYANAARLAANGKGKGDALEDGGQFGDLLKSVVGDVSQMGAKAETAAVDMARGKADIVDLVTAVAETEVAVETLVTVRDRVISAYQDILNMPI